MNRAARRSAVARRLVTPDGDPGPRIIEMQERVDRYAAGVRETHLRSAQKLEDLAELIELDVANGVIDVGALVDILRFLAAEHKKHAG